MVLSIQLKDPRLVASKAQSLGKCGTVGIQASNYSRGHGGSGKMEKARMLGTDGAVAGGTEGGRSPTGVPPATAAATGRGEPIAGNGQPIPDPGVPEKPVRRRFTAEYKLRTLREADRSTESGQLGAMLRRERSEEHT